MSVAVALDGAVRGLQLALLAVGMTLLFGLGGVLNLAHGAIVVLAAITVATATGALGVPLGLAAVVGIAVATLFGVLLDRTVLRPVHRRRGEARVLLSLLLTLAVALVVEGLLGWWLPTGALSIRVAGGPVDVLGVAMPRGALVAGALSLVAVGAVAWLLRGTVTGRAVRCVIEDEVGARLVGVDPGRMRTLVFALASALAGLVAVTSAMTGPVGVRDGFALTVLALVVAVVGGLGSASGALAAGLLLGVVEAASAATLGTSWTAVVLLATAAATILVRPRGLAGGRR